MGPWLRHVDYMNTLKKHKHTQFLLQQPTKMHQSGGPFLFLQTTRPLYTGCLLFTDNYFHLFISYFLFFFYSQSDFIYMQIDCCNIICDTEASCWFIKLTGIKRNSIYITEFFLFSIKDCPSPKMEIVLTFFVFMIATLILTDTSTKLW